MGSLVDQSADKHGSRRMAGRAFLDPAGGIASLADCTAPAALWYADRNGIHKSESAEYFTNGEFGTGPVDRQDKCADQRPSLSTEVGEPYRARLEKIA